MPEDAQADRPVFGPAFLKELAGAAGGSASLILSQGVLEGSAPGWLIVVLSGFGAGGIAWALTRMVRRSPAASRIVMVLSAVVFVVAAVLLSGAVVSNRPMPWDARLSRLGPGTDGAVLTRMNAAQLRAQVVADAAAADWLPQGTDLVNPSLSATLAGEPELRRASAKEWNFMTNEEDGEGSATLVRVRIAQITNNSDQQVTFRSTCELDPDRPEAAKIELPAAPDVPLLVTGATDGELALGVRPIGYEHGWWRNYWYVGDAAENTGGLTLKSVTGEPDPVDQKGASIWQSFGALSIAAPRCARASEKQQISDGGSGIDVTIKAGETVTAREGKPWQLIFSIPSPRNYELAGLPENGSWVPLGDTGYPFLFGGLYLVAEGYTALGVVRL